MYFTAVDATSRPHDFDARDRDRDAQWDEDAPNYWDTCEVEIDGTTYTVIDNNGMPWGAIIDGTIFDMHDLRNLADEGEDEDGAAPTITRHIVDEIESCEPYVWGSEGPMMNYVWPLNTGNMWSPFTAEDAARKLQHLPLCYVEMGGEGFLALTGGGMDLSWEIGAAYVALGFAPPVALDFPAMADDPQTRYAHVIDAMRESIDAVQRRMVSKLDHLARLQGDAR